jgi:hypothetical protein
MPRDLKKEAQARNKSVDIAKKAAEQRFKQENALEGADKIRLEISRLESVIRNCKFDLEGGFKGNIAIREKLNVAEKQLAEKQEELKKNV